MWWEFPPKSIQMLERFSCLVPASTTCRAVAVAKADQLSSDGHPAMQDELTRNLISARREAEQPFQDHRMSYVFHGLLQFHLGENRSREQKGLSYPSASNEAAALRVHLPRKCKCR